MPATSGPPEQASGASGTSSGLAPGSRWRRDFPGEGGQLGVLRRWLASLLPPCPARDDVVSVANELSSNANAPRGALLYPRCSREELKGGSWA
jgi:hypothetical protein